MGVGAGAHQHIVAHTDHEIGTVFVSVDEYRNLDGLRLALVREGSGKRDEGLSDIVGGEELLTGVGNELHGDHRLIDDELGIRGCDHAMDCARHPR